MKKTNQQWAAEVAVLKAQLPCYLASASKELEKTSAERFMASGVVISITDLTGKLVVTPFMCADGLESATIAALKSQIKKTLDLQAISSKVGA